MSALITDEQRSLLLADGRESLRQRTVSSALPPASRFSLLKRRATRAM